MLPDAIRISAAIPADVDALQPLRAALWPGSCVSELLGAGAVRAFDADYRIFLAREGAALVGFAEMTLRHDHVNGCGHHPVAFLEGIYVDPAHRRRGIARALVEAAAAWGQARGARDFASDAQLDNEGGHAFHRAVGFAETERVVYFRRGLGGRTA